MIALRVALRSFRVQKTQNQQKKAMHRGRIVPGCITVKILSTEINIGCGTTQVKYHLYCVQSLHVPLEPESNLQQVLSHSRNHEI